MTRFHWQARCEAAHLWSGWVRSAATARELHDRLEVEIPAAAAACAVCGSPAIVVQIWEAADRVSVRIVPLATMDPVSGRILDERSYVLEIVDAAEERRLRSRRAFQWAEAHRRVGHFEGLTWEQALRRWDVTGVDAASGVGGSER